MGTLACLSPRSILDLSTPSGRLMFQVVGAMAVEDGVVTAVIPQADKLTLPAIAKLRHELTAKARAGRLMLPVELG